MMFRKCPFCLQVWYKSMACTGRTTCGSRPMDADTGGWDSKINFYVNWKYNVMLNQVYDAAASAAARSLDFIFQENDQGMNRPQSSTQTAKKYVATNQQNPAGCGRYIVWREMPRLSAIELNQIYETAPSMRDYLKGRAESKEFGEVKKFESKIDKRWM